jgi:hypothetical protein
MKLLLVVCLISSCFAASDSFALEIHDILKGFFTGLHRNGSELIDHVKDPTQYIHRETLDRFVHALTAIQENPKDVSRYVTLFTESSTMLTELQKVFEVVGDFRDSEKLKDFGKMISNGNVKTFIFQMLTDALFFQDIQEVGTVFHACEAGQVPWDRFGLKLGELLHTIFSHVPKSLWQGVRLMADEDGWALQLHAILQGFFTGLRRNGGEIDHIKDPTQYIHRETIANFVAALGALHDNPKSIAPYVNLFTTSATMLTELQQVFEVVGDMKDSEALKNFATMLQSGSVKTMIFQMLTDAVFFQDIQEVFAIYHTCVAGQTTWDKFGLKLGELMHTIFSHVPKPTWTVELQSEDSWALQAHDIIRGFFLGLHRSADDVDKVADLTKYLKRETLFEFVSAIQSIGENPKDIARYVGAFQKASVLLVEIQQVVAAAGDLADAEKLQQFALMVKSGNMKDFFFGILTDFHFHQDAQEVIAVFKTCQAGTTEWSKFGTKLGELFHTILSHVPKPKI